MLMFLCVLTLTMSTTSDVSLSTWRFFTTFLHIIDFNCKFLCVDKTPVADTTINIIRKLCCFRKMDKMYMLNLVSMDF